MTTAEAVGGLGTRSGGDAGVREGVEGVEGMAPLLLHHAILATLHRSEGKAVCLFSHK
jgi:hypothetical protein